MLLNSSSASTPKVLASRHAPAHRYKDNITRRKVSTLFKDVNSSPNLKKETSPGVGYTVDTLVLFHVDTVVVDEDQAVL